jgi:hypothetical protein
MYFGDEAMKRLAKNKHLTAPQQMLIFNYKIAFEAFRAR